jgi:hypothetical protein
MRKRWNDVCFIGLLAAIATLVFQVAGWAQCQQPNTSTVACFTPGPNNPAPVNTCKGIPFLNCGSNVAVYTIKNFPDGSVNSPKGATQQQQANCYQYTTCTWEIAVGCVPGTQYPGAGNWFQVLKTVNNPGVTCPAPK